MGSESPRQAPRLIVRPSRPSDWSRLGSFLSVAWRESGPAPLGFAGAKEESLGEFTSESFLRRRLASPMVLMVVAEVGQTMVGLATVKRLGQREAEVVAITALKSQDAKETEARLLRKTLDVARKRGYALLVARADANDERTSRFYREAGFVESGKIGVAARGKTPERVFRRSLR